VAGRFGDSEFDIEAEQAISKVWKPCAGRGCTLERDVLTGCWPIRAEGVAMGLCLFCKPYVFNWWVGRQFDVLATTT
jgi:hypothetical protein